MEYWGSFANDEWVSPALLWYIAYLFAGLLLFQLGGWLLGRSSRYQASLQNYNERLVTWWIILVPTTIALLLGESCFMLFWALIGSLAVREILEVAPLHPSDHPLKFYLMAFPWLNTLAILGDLPMSVCLTFGLLVGPVYMLLHGNTDQFLQRVSYFFWLFIQIPLFLGFMGWLSHEAPGYNPFIGKAAIALWVIFIVQFSDAMQYLFGKLIGKRPILRKISPKKTWEGFLAGMVATSLVSSFVACELTVLSFTEALTFCFFIAMGGFLGDVTLSAVKRSLDLKDFSDFLKGHGGLLDRIDSLLFAAPIAYIALRFYN